MKKITVVVPVYNAMTSGGGLIRRCINSVLEQTFNLDDVEIILINDGSKDTSLDVLREYESTYPAIIRVINQQNMGVAETRNKAIDIAKGAYVVFIDQDDWIDTDNLSVFYQTIHKGNLDVVMGGYRRPDERGRIRYTIRPPQKKIGKYMVNASWAKIHRTQFLRENNIQFFNNKYGEDTIFTRREIVASDRWDIIDYVGYNWYYNSASVSSTAQKGLQHTDDFMRLLEARLKISDEDVRDKIYDLLKISIYHLLFSGRNTDRAHFMNTYERIFKWLEENVPGLYRTNYLPAGPPGEKFQAVVGINVFVLMHRLGVIGLFTRVYCRSSVKNVAANAHD